MSSELYRLGLENENFVVDRWSRNHNAFVRFAVAPVMDASGVVAWITVVDDDRIEVQTFDSSGGVDLWEISFDSKPPLPRRLWHGKRERGQPFAVFRASNHIIATNGDSIWVLNDGSDRVIDDEGWTTDIAVSDAGFAAANGHGIRTWKASVHGVERELRRDYYGNIGHVAALRDGWVFIARRRGALRAVVVDRELMPVYTIDLPRTPGWHLQGLGTSAAVIADEIAEGWLIERTRADRISWSPPLPNGSLAAGRTADVLWVTDGTHAVQATRQPYGNLTPAAGLRLGPRVLITTQIWQRVAYLAAAMLLISAVIGARFLRRSGNSKTA